MRILGGLLRVNDVGVLTVCSCFMRENGREAVLVFYLFVYIFIVNLYLSPLLDWKLHKSKNFFCFIHF